jgi:hypothetical protein
MRIWSIHPKYLDSKELLNLWNETIQAKNEFLTKFSGHFSNKQLERFLDLKNPLEAINSYMSSIYREAVKRDFSVDDSFMDWDFDDSIQIPVTAGQISHEISKLKSRLRERDEKKLQKLNGRTFLELHPIFYSVPGTIEEWENDSE